MSYPRLLLLLSLLALCLFLASLLIGPAGISPWPALRALFGGEAEALVLVMQEIRLPRALLGAIVGAALGLAGAAMQGLLRNPLAEPGLLGTSASAALGAVFAIHLGLSGVLPLGLPFLALGFAVVSVLMLLALAGPGGASLSLILAGIVITSMASALTSLILSLSPNPFATSEIVFWLMGSLSDRAMSHVAIAAPLVLVGGALVLSQRRGLDALTLGEDAATTMGLNLRRLKLVLVLGTALMVGGATAVAGAIGFIGLVVPHLLRRACGGVPSRLLLASALGGASVLLAADIAVRLITPEKDLKLGVLTTLVGAPFFLHLLLRLRREDVT